MQSRSAYKKASRFKETAEFEVGVDGERTVEVEGVGQHVSHDLGGFSVRVVAFDEGIRFALDQHFHVIGVGEKKEQIAPRVVLIKTDIGVQRLPYLVSAACAGEIPASGGARKNKAMSTAKNFFIEPP